MVSDLLCGSALKPDPEYRENLNMKKYIAGLMGFIMLISSGALAGCSLDSTNVDQISLSSAETIVFGKYHDEDIEWLVLDTTQSGSKLLLSKYVIEAKCFNVIGSDSAGYDSQSWENSDLRNWLNQDFLNESFTEAEIYGISVTSKMNKGNTKYHVKGTSETYDQVFLLSIDEAKAYFATEEDLRAKPMANTESELWVDEDGYCNWWLRSPGCDNTKSANVRSSGYVYLRGDANNSSILGVRPALWVNFESIEYAESVESSRKESEAAATAETTAKTIKANPNLIKFPYEGYATFGNYNSGSIDWIVLDKQDDKVLLITKDIIESRQYDPSESATTWEKCSLRSWLNDVFYEKAFSEAEKNMIITTDVVNNGNAAKGTRGGKDTQDNVFILSLDEANQYFRGDTSRQAVGSYNAVQQGLYVDSNSFSLWWLRTPGAVGYASCYVDHLGRIQNDGIMNRYYYIGVRPVIWVALK